MNDLIEGEANMDEVISSTDDVVSAEAIDIATETMTGDIRDAVLSWIKAQEKPWKLMTYAEQVALVDGAVTLAEDVARKAVHLIARDGRRTIDGRIEKLDAKDGIKVVVATSRHDPSRYHLLDAVGETVLIVLAGTDAFEGERGPAEPDAPRSNQLDMLDDGPVFDSTSMAAE